MSQIAVSNIKSAKDCAIEIGTNGTAWTDVSGYANKIDVSKGDREVGENFTFDGDTPILTVGKRKALEVKTQIFYTEGATEGFALVQAAYENGTLLYERYTPKGKTTGNKQYSFAAGYVTNPPYVSADVGDAKAMTFEYTLIVPSATTTTVP